MLYNYFRLTLLPTILLIIVYVSAVLSHSPLLYILGQLRLMPHSKDDPYYHNLRYDTTYLLDSDLDAINFLASKLDNTHNAKQKIYLITRNSIQLSLLNRRFQSLSVFTHPLYLYLTPSLAESQCHRITSNSKKLDYLILDEWNYSILHSRTNCKPIKNSSVIVRVVGYAELRDFISESSSTRSAQRGKVKLFTTQRGSQLLRNKSSVLQKYDFTPNRLKNTYVLIRL